MSSQTQTVYVISGPAGIGKTTVASLLSDSLSQSALIEGDLINQMVRAGHIKPWLSQKHLDLIWKNIACLAENFLATGMDVVIDYVAFPYDLNFLHKELIRWGPEMKYAVLLAAEDELMRRDQLRDPREQMGERSITLLKRFQESGVNPNHVLDTTSMSAAEVVKTIMASERFIMI